MVAKQQIKWAAQSYKACEYEPLNPLFLKGMHMYLLGDLQKPMKLYLYLGHLSSGSWTRQNVQGRIKDFIKNIVVASVNGSRSNKKRIKRRRKDHIREGLAAVDVSMNYILNRRSAIHWTIRPVRSHILQNWDESCGPH